jgi:hypothetical protein
MIETVVVMLIVAGCTGYAVWTLMPSSWRRALAARLGRPLRRDARACGGGCDGCGDSGPKPITVHRRGPGNSKFPHRGDAENAESAERTLFPSATSASSAPPR